MKRIVLIGLILISLFAINFGLSFNPLIDFTPVLVTAPVSTSSTASTTAVDLKGFQYAYVVINMSRAATTTTFSANLYINDVVQQTSSVAVGTTSGQIEFFIRKDYTTPSIQIETTPSSTVTYDVTVFKYMKLY